MTENDLEAVARLDSLAFSETDPRTGIRLPIPPRTIQNLLASLGLNPTGCFVAVADKPIGYLFSRIWGNLGWIGVFGVDPAHQGQDVGQALLRAGIEGLKEAGCDIIGLETRPDKPYNIGLYTGVGFRLTFPTLNCSKKVSSPANPASYTLISRLGEKPAYLAISQVSEAVQIGLDYTSEAKNAMAYQWGETFLFGWPSTWAFAVLRSTPRRKALPDKICEIDVLAIHPDHATRLEQVLQSVEGFALDLGVSMVHLSINAVDGDALKRILDYGFRVHSVTARMTLDHQIRCPPAGIDLSRWAM